MKAARIAATLILLLLAFAVRVHAQEPLAAARQLYASAEYESALGVLDGLALGNLTREDRQSIELYRALCLIAVGRKADADRTIEAMISQDPLYKPSGDLSPRMLNAFSDVRKRVLPVLVQQRYEEAKRAFDRKEYSAAASGFNRVMDLLSHPDIMEAAAQPPLSDMRTLASGFHDLSVKAIPPPIPLAAPPPAAMPVAAAAPVAPRVHVVEDQNVVPPVAIKQDLPRYPDVVRIGMKGVLEIIIDEAGTVESASMVVPTVASYDKLVLSAVQDWLYYPATVNKKPVKFRKRIQINISAE